VYLKATVCTPDYRGMIQNQYSEVPPSAAASAHAKSMGLQLGGNGVPFSGNFELKGLHSYRSGPYAGMAFFGTGGSEADETVPFDDGNKHRVDPAIAAWGGLVTISNCGGSDADNVCGAGTMTKAESGGWNNRVWDDQPCCLNCDCTGARWKVVADNTFCGFSAWSAAGSTSKDGDNKMASYMLQWHAGNLKAGQGGPDAGYSGTVIQTGLTFAADIADKFFEVHLTQTGADLVLDGATIHSIASAPADNQYRFGCATHNNGGGFSELAYRVPPSACALCGSGSDGTMSSCDSTPCPATSIGTDVSSGCACGPGQSGSITATRAAPYYVSSCVCDWDHYSDGVACLACESGQYNVIGDARVGSATTCDAAPLRVPHSLLAAGSNDQGRLGDGTGADQHVPGALGTLGTDNAAVTIGARHMVILKADGRVFAAGHNNNGQLGDGLPLGRGSPSDRYIPVEVTLLGSNNVAVSAGTEHTLYLKLDGRVFAVGNNGQGRLGDGTQDRQYKPVEITSLGSDNAAIAAGSHHSVYLKADGRVFAAGHNAQGRLGDGTQDQRLTPVELTSLGSDVAAICTSDAHTVYLKTDGRVFAAGHNPDGRLGDGTTDDQWTPVLVSVGSDNVAISAGQAHTIFLKSDGRVFAVGNNDQGRLGDGTRTRRQTPVELTSVGSDNVAVSAGHAHTMFLKSDGRVFAVGNNDQGRLGDGTTMHRQTPVELTLLGASISFITAGADRSVYFKAGCYQNFYSNGAACVPCVAGKSNAAGDARVGPATVCDETPCPGSSTGTNVAGGCSCGPGETGSVTASTLSPYFVSSCVCDLDHHWDGFVCVPCVAGKSNAVGDARVGPATVCDEALSVRVIGGNSRTFGWNTSNFTLVAESNAGNATVSYVWRCVERTSMQVILTTTSTGGSWVIDSSRLAIGAPHTCTVTSTLGRYTANASMDVEVARGNPPVVSIEAPFGKCNPSSRLKLFASVDASKHVALVWTIAIESGSNAFASVDLLTSTGLESPNLVVQADEMVGGRLYRFTVHATSAEGSAVTSIIIPTNMAPLNGSLSCIPSSGTAVITQFYLVNTDWYDDDLPLLYRFAARIAIEPSSTQYLHEYSIANSSLVAILPAGEPVTLISTVLDSFGARATAETTVHVAPYTIPSDVSMNENTASLLAAAASRGDSASSLGQLITSLASVLNAQSSEENTAQIYSQDDAIRARDTLLYSIIDGDSIHTLAAAARAGQLMGAITAKPKQLSSNGTDKALNFVEGLVATFAMGDSNVDEVATNVATVMSNLLLASISQQSMANNETAGRADRMEKAKYRANQLSSIVDSVASALVGDLVIGEKEKVVATETFNIRVSVDTPHGFENSTLGGGIVRVPLGGLASVSSRAVAAKVVTWEHGGPYLLLSQGVTPHLSGANTSTLTSPVIDIKFIKASEVDDIGAEVSVRNLTHPFELTLLILDNATQEDEVVSCAHFSPVLDKWVNDGVLVSQTATSMQCQFTHLTAFGGFSVPNSLSSVDDLFSLDLWAKNLVGLVAVLCLLAITVGIIVWSLCAYIRSVRMKGRAVSIEDQVTTTHYAASLVAISYTRARRCTIYMHKLRTQSDCAPLLCPVKGDPFVRSQRMTLIFITLLSTLFFSGAHCGPL
jgi:alpha-tubulin suppressor-like RCC1 family protein